MEQANNNLQVGEHTNQTIASSEQSSQISQMPPAISNQPTSPKESWRTVLSILLIILFGPIGIIVMWGIARWSKMVKGIITAVVMIPLVILLISMLFLAKSIDKYVNKRIEWSKNPNSSIADIPIPPGLNSNQNQKMQMIIRDSKIREDIAEWKVALAVYQANNSLYPQCPSQKSKCYIKELNLIGDSTLNLGDNKDYLYWSNGEDFKIQFQLEKEIDQVYKGMYCETSQNSTQGPCF